MNKKSSPKLTHEMTHKTVTHASDGESETHFKSNKVLDEEPHERVLIEEEKNDNSFMKQSERNRNSSQIDINRNRFKNWIQSTDGNDPINSDDNENYKMIHTIDIIEEDSDIPKLLIKVGTSNTSSDVTYFINSSNYDQLDFSRKFKLNSSSGELYIVTPLDRDLPFGRPLWHFSIMAKHLHSNDPFAYADVVINVNDINDNTPFFDQTLYHAHIVENSPADLSILQITATDYDSSINGNNKIRYLIDRNHLTPDGNTIFSIDGQTGLITSSVCCFDRETNTQFVLQITAVDSGGLKGSTTVIINIIDVNDCGPKFSQNDYLVQVLEHIRFNTTILYFSVIDDDLPISNHNKYEIIDKSNKYMDLFSISTNHSNSGFVIINGNISQISDKILNLTLSVTDRTASRDNTDLASLTIIININTSICSNSIFCNNGGHCVKNDDNGLQNSISNKSVTDLYHCQCLNGFEGVLCDFITTDDNTNYEIISAEKLYQILVNWFKSDNNSALVVVLFALVNVLVILMIGFIYRRISHKFNAINRRTSVRSDPLSLKDINNSLTEEQNINREQNLNELTVISVPSHDYCSEEVVEESAGDQCPDVVDCCSRIPSRTRHVFITDPNTKWQKSITANCSSLDDIRLYGNEITGITVWTTTASASMELIDSNIDGNVIYV